ncbi:hypothetical protein QBZ16_001322 [Prototheca wickerhamii]|uniref:Glutamate decarboxylase n=1 Tax=Prototheca wickerhamii TaxID=3111 RepID=A0AAD9IEG0_PROWI|nr:hypothetical protein QBZ16_001322 [Prototheca wickerhamii]
MLTKDERTPLYGEEHVEADMLSQYGCPAPVAYQLIADVRSLDSTPKLNLASFVTTWMEPEARKLINESLDVNYVDADEYPSCTEVQNRCLNILAKLYHAPSADQPEGTDQKWNAVGTATIGSSEAIMLGALALKKRWQNARKAAGKDTSKPNLVMGRNTHVCWQKYVEFCRYFDVEERYVMCEDGRYAATAELLEPLIDEHTIGVAAVFGTTFTGEFEDVEAIDAMISRINEKNGWEVRIHVDGASGAFVAPFLYPDLKWDFRLKNVASINASGHKYGLVYPGIGWVLWRDQDHLPDELVFEENYLGTTERSITLNFSKGAANIVAQYYQFLRLGFLGYRKIMLNLDVVRKRLRSSLGKLEHFEILSPEIGVPVVSIRLNPIKDGDGKTHTRMYDEFDIAERLRFRGWVVPAFTMPENAENVKVLRITIREDLSVQMADKRALDWLDTHFILTHDQARELAKKRLALEKASAGDFVHISKKDMTVRPC